MLVKTETFFSEALHSNFSYYAFHILQFSINNLIMLHKIYKIIMPTNLPIMLIKTILLNWILELFNDDTTVAWVMLG